MIVKEDTDKTKIKKIAIIGIQGIPAQYGGFETLAEHLTKNLTNKYNITVFCSTRSYIKKIKHHNGSRLEYINLNANGVQSILYDIISIFKSLKFANVLLIFGVSGCVILPLIKPLTRIKIIINIDGLEWKRDKWGKATKWFLKLSEKMAIKYADEIVCDNRVIQEYVGHEYNVESTLIVYGADHVKTEAITKDNLRKFSFLSKKYALNVCRIEPENNIHLILKAFSLYEKLILVIIGNWDNSNYGRNLKEKYENFDGIYLLDSIYDQKILNQFRSNCYLYIHGHSAGGTNPSLVEAMYLELPIFAYAVDYNKETTQNKAKYFKNIGELIVLLEKSNSTQLEAIAANMKEIAIENYTWEKISKQYAELF